MTPPTLRVETDADRGLLEALFADLRASELSLLPDASMRRAFVRQQVEARERGWRDAWPDADRLVVVVDDEAGGRLLVDVAADRVHVVDIALLRGHRGRGLGTHVLDAVLAQADAAGLPCELSVDHGSPAKQLYDRLGFVDAGGDELRHRMCRPATSAQAKAAS
jgi:GNAT superfamily N-acetyltransferase